MEQPLTAHGSLASAAAQLLQHPILCDPDLTRVPSSSRCSRRLSLKTPPDLLSILRELGCSQEASTSLNGLYHLECARLREACETTYAEVEQRLEDICLSDTEAEEWSAALERAINIQYKAGAARLRDIVIGEIRAAQLRHSTSPPPPPPPASDAATTTLSGHFTPAITALLQSAYDAHATGALPNKGERRELARATGLSEKQVVTWVSERPRLWKIELS